MEKFAQTSHALLPVGHWRPVGNAVGMFSLDYLAEPLTPYPLPTKDGGLLRTIGDARAYMVALSEERERDSLEARVSATRTRCGSCAVDPSRFTSRC